MFAQYRTHNDDDNCCDYDNTAPYSKLQRIREGRMKTKAYEDDTTETERATCANSITLVCYWFVYLPSYVPTYPPTGGTLPRPRKHSPEKRVASFTPIRPETGC